MWISRRKSSREIDNIDCLIRRSTSSKNSFVRSSLKDVENLFAANDDGDCNGFNKTLGQPSTAATTTTTVSAAARPLSIFHRVHLANKFARAFSDKQTPSPEKLTKSDRPISIPARPTPESDNVTKTEKSDCTISVPAKSPPESNNLTTTEKPAKSDRTIAVSSKSPPESNNLTTTEKPVKPDRTISVPTKSDRPISIPGAEKLVVVYTTSLRVVRPTFEACRTVQSILRGFRVSIDERDLSMDSRFLTELQNLMTECNGNGNGNGAGDVENRNQTENSEKTKVTLPRVFIGGRYIGGAEEVKELHESGELKKVIEGLPAVSSVVCGGCAGVGFILCDECRGSHMSYNEKGGFRSCTLCNENGLVRCTFCLGR